MEDPWAAPAWSTPAKPSSSSSPQAKAMSMSPPRGAASFDVSDPWGAPAAPVPAEDLPTMVYPSETEDGRARTTAPETPGWGREAPWTSDNVPASRPPEPQSPTPRHASTPMSPNGDNSSWGETDLTSPVSPPPRISFDSAPALGHQTPPKPFSALPDFASPRSPLSHHSPHSHRSMTPVSHPMDNEEDPEAAFAAALPRTSSDSMPKFDMPKSPSFGEGDFGGFSSGLGDPWGGGEKVGWGGDERVEEQYEAGVEEREEESGEGWGYVRPAPVEAPGPRMEQDWEAAQKKIQLQESLAPHDKVERLKTGWKEVAGAVIGLRKLPEPTPEEIQSLEASLRKLENDRDETLRSLAAIPSNIDTYPPVLSSMTTHTTYLTSLSRPNPSPGTSLLHSNLGSKRARRTDPNDRAGTEWLSRSRLGEPEVSAGEAAPAEQEAKSRWAFWGRKAAEKQLITSGGGVLEVKSPTSAVSEAGELRKSTSQHFPAVGNSIAGRSSPSLKSPESSRPTSLFEAPPIADLATPPTATNPPTTSTVQPPPTSAPTSATMTPAPSAVSRFFGRLRRNPSTGPQPDPSDPSDPEISAKDLELGEEDFSYLGQVPSFAPPQTDLFDTHEKPTHEMANLEHMIASRPTPLPAPLAPPPGRAGMGSRTASGTGQRAEGRRNDMDLLSGLYDEEDGSGGGSQGVLAEMNGPNDPIGWNDFLGPSPAPAAPAKPSSAPRLPSFSSPPTASAPAPQSNSGTLGPSSDFDDFGTPQKATSNGFTSGPTGEGDFGDFGDFSAFDQGNDDHDISTPPPPPPPRQTRPINPTPSLPAPSGPSARIPFLLTPAQPSHPPPTSYRSPLPIAPRLTPSIKTHEPRRSLDHTPTLNLVNDASTTKGRRWPAPPSPEMPDILPPPPGRTNPSFGGGGGGFPFLSPPPPPRPGSRAGSQMRDMLGGEVEGESAVGLGIQGSDQGSGTQGLQQQLMSPVSVGRSAMMPTPPRSVTPAQRELAAPAAVGGGKGLSAQDLSFFDNL